MEGYGPANVTDLLKHYESIILRFERAEPTADGLENLAELNRQICERLDILCKAGSPAYLPCAKEFAKLLERGTLERMASARANQSMFS